MAMINDKRLEKVRMADSSKSPVIQDGMSSIEPSTGHFEWQLNSFASGIDFMDLSGIALLKMLPPVAAHSHPTTELRNRTNESQVFRDSDRDRVNLFVRLQDDSGDGTVEVRSLGTLSLWNKTIGGQKIQQIVS